MIGVNGSGMSNLGCILRDMGYLVSGSDLKNNCPYTDLSGIKVFQGHNKDYVNAKKIIVSSAIDENNPEIQRALKLNLPIIKRGKCLADIANEKKLIAVAGSHGKTTISALLTYFFTCASSNPSQFPSYAVGGKILNLDGNGAYNKGDNFILEADESDRSFLHLKPNYSIITNIDREHMNAYKDFDDLVNSFAKFAKQTNEKVIYCADNKVLNGMNIKNAISYGFGFAGVTGKVLGFDKDFTYFDVKYVGKDLGTFKTQMFGRHNVLNIIGAITLAKTAGIDHELIKAVLPDFRGTGRRLEKLYENSDMNIACYDDYGHHPEEIKATLNALKGRKDNTVAIFQPHRPSRIKDLFNDFSRAFYDADIVNLTDIYRAGENPINGIDLESLRNRIQSNNPNKIVNILQKKQILPYIVNYKVPNSNIVLLTAGDAGQDLRVA